MTLTRDIVRDLLPLYVEGEASADTRAAVEAWLRGDPELSRLAEALRAGEAAPAAPSHPEGAREALSRTKRLLARRTWLLASALFFTGLPLSFAAGREGLIFFLLRDAPGVASISLVVAANFWIAFAVTTRRLKVVGL